MHFSNDITWCADVQCTRTDCFRNQANRHQKTGAFSIALLKDTENCKLNSNNHCIWAQASCGDMMCTNDKCPACADYCPKEGQYSEILNCKYEELYKISEDISK